MVEVTFIEPDGNRRVVSASVGLTLMEVARNDGIRGIEAECGGACACSTCHVYIAGDWVDRMSERTPIEEDMLDFAHEPDPATSRLACQIPISEDLDGLIISVPQRQC